MPRGAYGPPRDLGPGDLGVRQLADDEEQEDKDARREAHDRDIEDAVALGDYDEED